MSDRLDRSTRRARTCCARCSASAASRRRCVELYSATKIRGFLHLYIGEEAVAVGVMQALAPDDAVVATYREHGHALARGVPAGRGHGRDVRQGRGLQPRPRRLDAPLRRARRRFYGGNAIVGGGLPLAVGLALADKLQDRRRVTACFFGEGAVAEGEFHESMNLAALWRLPVLFCCENNLYAMGTALARSESETDLALKAAALRDAGLAGRRHGRARRRGRRPPAAATRSARGGGPALPRAAHLPLPRPLDVRPRALPRARTRSSAGSERDPIDAVRAHGCAQAGLLDDADARRRSRPRSPREVDAAVAFAEAGTLGAGRGPRPASSTARRHDGRRDRRTITYREAMRAALRDALRADARVFLMGEDVGRYGGCFAVSQGPARGVRPGAHPRHAAVGVGLRRRRHRRRARRHAADRRDHDGQLQPARARPDREQRRHAPAHVGRPVQRAARDPHDDRRRPPARRAALAQPRGLVRAHPGPQGARAGDARGRARHAVRPRSRTPTRC